MQQYTSAYRFHGYYDVIVGLELYKPGQNGATSAVEKHFVIKERTLGYQFYPHFHPYVAELVSRLVKGSVRGLQDTDTRYKRRDDGSLVSLPGSTRIALASGVQLNISGGTQVTLLEDVQATLAGGASVSLAGNMRIKLIDETQITLPDGAQVALLNWADSVRPAGTSLSLLASMSAIFLSNTRATLTSTTQVALLDGTQVTIPGGKQVALLRETQVTLPSTTPATLLGSKPKLELYEGIFDKDHYDPSGLVLKPYPVKDLDFTSSGAYAVYNWELFYHIPLTIAIHLSKNQRFEESMQWFHYIFDPTDNSDGPTPERFWKVKPFQYTDVKQLEEILVNLSTGADKQLQQDTIKNIDDWKDAPFRPYLVARHRQSAYMFKTVMAYLDNLIAWGDILFRQDTGESINEATQLYVLAANILGPRPQEVPKKGSVRPQTYAGLKANLDEFGNALVKIETSIPFDLTPHPTDVAGGEGITLLSSLGQTLYFCVPRNDNLLSYWDTVADRLFKIRNSLNIQGIFRQLPLFEPPIDPALLARAVAAGLDVGAIVSGVNQPLPLVRFQFLVQKAAEICQEVKSLGNNLLSAIEKEDNEALAILRAKHERVILGLTETVKYAQWQEAIKAREGLEQSLANAFQRYTYYEQQLGKQANEITLPPFDALDGDGLAKMKFNATEPAMGLEEIKVDLAQNLSGDISGKKLSSREAEEMNKLSQARDLQNIVQDLKLAAQGISLLPQFGIKFHFWGLGGDTSYGGFNLGKISSFAADVALAISDRLNYEAGRAAKLGSYDRREQEWKYQSNLAAGEITQIFKQLRAAQIREAITEREWENHQQQILHAEEIEYFLTGKKNENEWTQKIDTNKVNPKKANIDFYTWMKREVKGLYAQCFQFAFDIAKKAERALQHELGNPTLSFLQFGYLAGKEGLLAGEKLYLDIKRMEMAYHDLNRREYELTKHVSLLQVNPQALLQLRTAGRCTVFLPEELFDLDCPGHYFRRMKSVAVSIPCVVGPYASVNCTLTLLKSSIRKSPLLGSGYAREGDDPDRFDDHFGSLQAIVTSTGQNDSGLFETNLRDERYLPFEGSGIISEWQLELPADVRQFDYDTISDIIFHLRYTAREGGGLLRSGAIANLTKLIVDAQAPGSVRLFDVRHEFPTEWAKFNNISEAPSAADLTLSLREEHFPYWSKGRLEAITSVNVFTKLTKESTEITPPTTPSGRAEVVTYKINPATREKKEEKQAVEDLTEVIPLPKPPDTFTLTFNLHFANNSMENIWLAVTWGKGE